MNPWHVPGYTEIAELGSGSQGRVVLARSDQDDDEPAAIKYLTAELLADPRRAAIFRREAQILATLDAPHIARLRAYVESPEGAAIVMEAVNGVTLRAVLNDRDAGLAPEAALAILKGSLLGLAAAHDAGVVHRDYKPSNIMVTAEGDSKLIDFGIAVLAGHRSRAGTPAYMAPEQWRGEPASPATDVYSATCVFYECVTGNRPFGDDTTTLEEQHLTAPVPARHVPRPLRTLVEHGMAKAADQRPPGATAFVSDLETAAVAAYGPDWQQRGIAALTAAALTAALPIAAFAALHTPAAAAIGHTAQGILARLTRAKVAGATAGATAAGVIAAYALWPQTPPALLPTVGGTQTTTFAFITNHPSVIARNPIIPNGSAASGYVQMTATTTPARIRPGVPLNFTFRNYSHSLSGMETYYSEGHYKCSRQRVRRNPRSAYYYSYLLGYGDWKGMQYKDGKSPDPKKMWLFPIASTNPGIPPTTHGISANVTKSAVTIKKSITNYDNTICGYVGDTTTTLTITFPQLPPGRYLLSLLDRPGEFYGLVANDHSTTNRDTWTTITEAQAGEQILGNFPYVTVLPPIPRHR